MTSERSVHPLSASRRATRDESGAIAVMFALLALVLLGVSALAIDVGQVYAKRAALQSNVDLAVLAATAELNSNGACNQEVINVATTYLELDTNKVPDQAPVNLGGSAADGDGFIQCSNWHVKLWAPFSHVDYGLSRAVISDATANRGADVPAFAEAAVKAAGAMMMPTYAVQGCDEGSQIIRDDSGPAPARPVPPLTPTSAAVNTATFTVTPTITPFPTAPPLRMTINGANLTGATAVGFTTAGGPPDHFEVPAAQFLTSTATQITLNVPPEVLNTDDVWFVRILKGANWSAQSGAQRFTVGEPRLYCANSVEGNFGTLNVARFTNNNKALEYNLALGLEVELAIHPNWSTVGMCARTPLPTIETASTPRQNANCIETEPGLMPGKLADGLLGVSSPTGRLVKNTTPSCGRNGSSARVASGYRGTTINDDLLACFIINDANINDLVRGTGRGLHALSPAIFDSPRFFRVPVVQYEPGNGRKSWPIKGFRPAFITQEPLSLSNSSYRSWSAPSTNGMEMDGSGVRALHVVIFDEAALPETAPADGGEADYAGSGPKVVVLVK